MTVNCVLQTEKKPCQFCSNEVDAPKGAVISACLDNGKIHLVGPISKEVKRFIEGKGGKV